MIGQKVTKTNDCETIRYDIFIAGDASQARQVCRKYCFEIGLCVTVESVLYIYKGGEELGVRVGLINYPRFPSEQESISGHAKNLADLLMVDLCQHSYSIVGPSTTTWASRRVE